MHFRIFWNPCLQRPLSRREDLFVKFHAENAPAKPTPSSFQTPSKHAIANYPQDHEPNRFVSTNGLPSYDVLDVSEFYHHDIDHSERFVDRRSTGDRPLSSGRRNLSHAHQGEVTVASGTSSTGVQFDV
jgi:hypothetical protein